MLRIKKRPFIQPRATVGLSAFLIGLVGSVGILQALNSSSDNSSDVVNSSKVRSVENSPSKKKTASDTNKQDTEVSTQPSDETATPKAPAPAPAWTAPLRQSSNNTATYAAPYYPQSTVTPQSSTYNAPASSPSPTAAPAPAPAPTQTAPSVDTAPTDGSGTTGGTGETNVIDETVQNVTAPLEDTSNVLE